MKNLFKKIIVTGLSVLSLIMPALCYDAEKSEQLKDLVITVSNETDSQKRTQIFKDMEYLIKKGADVNYEYEYGWLQLPPPLFDKNTKLPVFEAISAGDIETVKFLLEHGADVYKTRGRLWRSRQTPLEFAAAEKQNEIAELLQAFGVKGKNALSENLTEDNDTGYMMTEACSKGTVGVVKKLLREGAKPTSHDLVVAAHTKNYVLLKLLLESGIDVNQPDYEGEYPLLPIISLGTLEDLELFIQYGADLNVERPSPQGGTVGPALVLASFIGDLSKVKYLLEHGAEIDGTNKSGSTPLIVASSERQKEVAAYLLENGADVNITNNHDDTALMVAAEKGSFEIVKLLLSAGARVNAQNKHGDTALMFVAENGNKEIARLLIDSGADLNLRDTDGSTALNIALKELNDDIADMLKEAGATE